MTSKRVLLLLSSDRYAYPLLRYLSDEGKIYGWKIRVGCMFDSGMAARLTRHKYSVQPEIFSVTKMQECEQAIKKTDLVIGVVTDSHLLQVADACILYRKSLISPGALNRQMVSRKAAAKENNILMLLDCGFSPGLDHITAKKAIDNILAKGGRITSFKTYSGSFAPDATGNPWGFRMVEPVAELLNMGKQTNRHLREGHLQHIPYHRLFERAESITAHNMPEMVAIAAGDSLYYRKIYGLTDAHTVVKGKLMPGRFDRVWDVLVKLGVTDTASRIDLNADGPAYSFLDAFVPYAESHSLEERLMSYSGASSAEIEKLKWVGLFDIPMPSDQKEVTPGMVLQELLEQRLSALPEDQDLIIMEHYLSYEFREEHYEFRARLISRGDHLKEGALAKAIGLTCGVAAKSFLLGSISAKGLHTPVIREVYDPILNELSDLGVAFHVEEKKLVEPEPAVR